MHRYSVGLSVRIAIWPLLFLFSGQAFAVAVLTIQRIDDYTAIISGEGTIAYGGGINLNSIYLDDTFSVHPTGSAQNQNILDGSTMSINGNVVDGAAALGGPSYLSDGVYGIRLYNSALEPLYGSPIIGSVALALSPDFQWAAIGSTGFVYNDIGPQGNSAGSWYMVAASPVPLPPAVWLFSSGLLGLVGISRRKKVA